MGSLLSHQNAGVEEVDVAVNHAYRYPPRQGNYFANHYIMGGESFDTGVPEMYLFGDNSDLNFLGSRPAPFPYPPPNPREPSMSLKALVNIRKESLRFVKVAEECASLKDSEPVLPSEIAARDSMECKIQEPPGYNIEFTLDTDVRCAVTVMYFCQEEATTTGLTYKPRDASLSSETFLYKAGANQAFSQSSHVFRPARHPAGDLAFSAERREVPLVVHCVALEGPQPRQSQATLAAVERQPDGGHFLKPLKQRHFIGGLTYLLQELYGIENKGEETDTAYDGAECVICMSDLRDTLILPCRHLCLCNCCADSLRYQANNCPICRAPFRALLQVKALRKAPPASPHASPRPTRKLDPDAPPPGYEAVSLIEALNGPSAAPPPQPPLPRAPRGYLRLGQGHEESIDAEERAERSSLERAEAALERDEDDAAQIEAGSKCMDLEDDDCTMKRVPESYNVPDGTDCGIKKQGSKRSIKRTDSSGKKAKSSNLMDSIKIVDEVGASKLSLESSSSHKNSPTTNEPNALSFFKSVDEPEDFDSLFGAKKMQNRSIVNQSDDDCSDDDENNRMKEANPGSHVGKSGGKYKHETPRVKVKDSVRHPLEDLDDNFSSSKSQDGVDEEEFGEAYTVLPADDLSSDDDFATYPRNDSSPATGVGGCSSDSEQTSIVHEHGSLTDAPQPISDAPVSPEEPMREEDDNSDLDAPPSQSQQPIGDAHAPPTLPGTPISDASVDSSQALLATGEDKPVVFPSTGSSQV